MGKMKELFMSMYYPNGIDLEREYLMDDLLAKERDYNEFQQLQQDQEMNILNTKIEVGHGKSTIEIGKEKQESRRETQRA